MNKSIGLFDSGVGGISILNSLVTKLPDENFIYLSDNKNCPYGDKSQEEITILSIKNSKKLIELNCKIIIVACNTATTNCIEFLRKEISSHFLINVEDIIDLFISTTVIYIIVYIIVFIYF